MVPVETVGEAAGVKTGGGVLEHVLFKIQSARAAQGFAGSHHRGCHALEDWPGHSHRRNQSARRASRFSATRRFP